MASSDTPATLCEFCRGINFDLLLPQTELHLPDATGAYFEYSKIDSFDNRYEVALEDGIVQKFLRQPDGILQRYDPASHDPGSLLIGSPAWTLKDVVSRSETCSLCKYIATVFANSVEWEASRLATNEFDQNDCYKIYLSIDTLGHVCDDSRGLPFEVSRWKHWTLRGLNFYCSNGNLRDRRKAHVLLEPLSSRRIPGEPDLLARYRPAVCNVSLFRSWLCMCTESHPACFLTANMDMQPLRLIDVTNMCLVTFNGPEKAENRYFALSYVWGDGPKDFALSRANMEDYCRPQGLPALPRTLSDAIVLTIKMEERYLWVDSLCIISDDPQDKATQIPAMTSIYGCAALTIVAAAGRDATHGLPGIRIPRPQTMKADLGFCHIVQPVYACRVADFPGTTYGRVPVDPLYCTKWASRAWTYQELLLSPRSLIFLDDQVVWNCRCSKWVEELNIDHPNMTFRWPWKTDRASDTSLTAENYSNLVSDSTKRELTFEGDIIDAFRGIMEAVPIKIFWGIPLLDFGRHLLWNLWNEKSDPHRNCKQKVPSWSWFAWKGQITMRAPSCLLTIYRWKQGQLQQIHAPLVASDLGTHQQTDRDLTHWVDPTDGVVKPDDIPEGVVLNENQLIFWGLVWEADGVLEMHDQVLVATRPWIHICTLVISRHKNVTHREGYRKWVMRDYGYPQEKHAVRRLIILE
jgi:hypothetical protein